MEKTRHYALILLGSICVTYFVEGFLRTAANALTPILIEELKLSHGAMGVLISALSLSYGLMQIPSGILSQKYGARRIILGFTIISIVGVILFWYSKSYNLLLVAQILIGLGCSTFYINAVKLLSTWFPPNRTATAIGILSSAFGLANFIAFLGFPWAVEVFGSWRPLYLAMSLILVINWGMNIFIIKDREQQEEAEEKDSPPLLQTVKETLTDRRLYPFIAGYMLSTVAWVYMTWMPQFMIDVRGLTYFQVGQIASAGSIAGIPGSIIISAISDWLKKRKAPLVGFSAMSAVLIIMFLMAPASTPVYLFSVLNFLIGFSFSFWVLMFSMVPETLPPKKASIGLGLVNGMGTVGFSLFAPIYGYFVDITDSYTASNQVVLVMTLLMPVIFFLFIKECYGGIYEEE
jgi:MFS family permease